MNSVGWMVGKGESISISPSLPGFEQVYLSDIECKSVVPYWTVAVIPGLFALAGVRCVVRRRNL